MRAVLMVLGVMLFATGVVWILQGLNLLKGSFMTGRAFWAWMGVVAVMVGLSLAVGGMRRRAR
jgi:membrane protein implicated in regulation of membrane protease activity